MPKLEKQLAIIIRKRMFKQQVYILSIGNMNPFMPLASFYTPWKHHKTRSLLMFYGGIKETSGVEWVNK